MHHIEISVPEPDLSVVYTKLQDKNALEYMIPLTFIIILRHNLYKPSLTNTLKCPYLLSKSPFFSYSHLADHQVRSGLPTQCTHCVILPEVRDTTNKL